MCLGTFGCRWEIFTPGMESRGCIEALGLTLLGMRAVGGYTFCCEFSCFTVRYPDRASLTRVRNLVVSYNMLKKRGSEGGEEPTTGKTLLYAAEAS